VAVRAIAASHGAIDRSVCYQLGLSVDHNCQRQAHVCRGLGTLGLAMHRASTLLAAKEMIKKECYQVFILNCDTIGRESSEFCGFVRSNNAHAILVTTMSKTNVSLEGKLFDCGADDVVAGDHMRAGVFVKRIKAHLARPMNPALLGKNPIRLKDTVVDFDRSEVRCNGIVRPLAGNLADLLKYFLDHPNRVISREELMMSKIWVKSVCWSPKDKSTKTFDVTVSKLRKVIEPDPAHPQIIISVRGQGWKLAADAIR
jgi:DNA-binding response OmpR family regulator